MVLLAGIGGLLSIFLGAGLIDCDGVSFIVLLAQVVLVILESCIVV